MELIKQNEFFRVKIINEINKCRSNPKSYIQLIKNTSKCFFGKVLKLPDKPGIMTNEGIDAFNEASNFLSKMKSLNQMTYSAGLSHIAHDFIKDLQTSEDLDSDENIINLQNIIDKYGNIIELKDLKYYLEFAPSSPEMFVLSLIVCDGDPNRTMRKTLFENYFNFVGVASGQNFLYDNVTAVFFAHNFNEKSYTEIGKQRASVFIPPTQISNENIFDVDIFSENFSLSPNVERMERIDKIITERGQKFIVSKVTIYTKDGGSKKKIFKKLLSE